MADTRTDKQKAEDVIKYLKVLSDIRSLFEPMMDEIVTYVNWSRRKITDKGTIKGQKTGIEVYSSGALLAKNLLVDGMMGIVCPRNMRWAAYTLPGKWNFPRSSGMRAWTGKRMDSYPQVRQWLQDSEEVAYAAFNRSNFYDVMPEFISDGATVGTATQWIEEDVSEARTVFTVPHYRENYIAVNQWGRVDTNYREYSLTLRQLVDKFGMEKMTSIDRSFAEDYKHNMHDEREVIHAVYPRKDYNPDAIDSKSKPWASLWVYTKGTELLDELGYDCQPFVTWRWRANNDEWYGRSPSWDAFVEIVKKNQQGRTNLIAAHKMAEPPLVAPADLRGAVQTGPRGFTYIDAPRGTDIRLRAPFPLHTGLAQTLPYSVEMEQATDEIIGRHFHTQFFMMLNQIAMQQKVEITATQVIEMLGEQAAILGTRVGMLYSEGLNPINERVFEIEARAGRMPYPPQILWDANVDKPIIEYLGPLAQAQIRLSKVRSITGAVQLAGQMAQVLGPFATDKINPDATMDEIFSATGFPASCLNDDITVARIRELRNQQQDMLQQAEIMHKIGKAASSAAKGAQKDSPLAAVMGSPKPSEEAEVPVE